MMREVPGTEMQKKDVVDEWDYEDRKIKIHDATAFKAMRAAGIYHTKVIVNSAGRIVATATLLIERKFLRGCATVRSYFVLCRSS